MDEASWNGTSGEVIDSSGNGNHGVGVGATPPTTGAGKFGNGGVFDGSDDYVDLGNKTIYNTGNEISISIWVKPKYQNHYEPFFERYEGTNNRIDFGFFGGSQNRLYMTYSNGVTRDPNTISNISSYIPENSWHHIVFTANAKGAKTYIDGNLIDTSPLAGNFTINASLHLGNRGGEYYDGSIDEVRIYNRALSPAEVRDLYNWAPEPVTYYNFDEGSGTILHDRSGNGNNSTSFVGSPTWSQGNSLPSTALPATQKVTICTWAKGQSEPRTNSIFEAADGSANRVANVHINYSNGNTYWDFGDTTYDRIYKSNDSGTYNNWNHWCFLADNEQNVMSIYLNGTLWLTENHAKGLSSSPTAFTLGANDTADGTWYKGWIDEFKIYNYARTQKQIVEDMNAGHPVGGSPVSSKLLHFKLDEGYGTTVNDSGHNGDSGELIDGPTWTNDGKFNKGLTLDGLNDRIQNLTSAPFEYRGGDMTYSLWFKPNSSDTDNGRIFSKPWNGSGEYNYYLNFNGSSNTLSFSFYNGDAGSDQTIVSSSGSLTDGEWNHIVITMDGGLSKVSLYINGKYDNSASHSITNWEPVAGDNNVSLLFGCLFPYGSGWSGNTGFCVQGEIDEIKVYNAALTEDEIKLDYNQGKTIVMGATSTDSSGNPDWSSAREYCIPGDTSYCAPPVAEWKFDEKTGTTAYDTSGNGNNGTLTDMEASDWVVGKKGAALKFDGTDDYVDLGDVLNLSLPVSVSMWVKLDSLEGLGKEPFVSETYAPAYRGIRVNIQSDGDLEISYGSNGTGSTGRRTKIATANIQTDKWYFIAGVIRGATDMDLYLDGVDIGGVYSGSGGELYNGPTSAGIGIRQRLDGFFPGLIDDVRVYDYARTPAQIAWEYNRGKPVGWWKFDECQGVVAHDSGGDSSTPSQNDGSINIGASAPQTSAGTCTDGQSTSAWYNGRNGKYNASLNFDGVDDWVNCGSSTQGSVLDLTERLTLSAWIKSDKSGSTGNMDIVNRDDGGSQRQYNIHLTTGGLLRVYLNGTPVNGTTNLNSGGATWYHVAATWDKDISEGQIKVYVNGILENTGTRSSALTSYTQAVNVGRRESNYFDGQIDDVRIYNYALTPLQVKQLYNEGAAIRFGPETGSP